MPPRPTDLAALASLLPPAAVVLAFDLETCAAPGGDARAPGKCRIVQLGIAAFSSSPLPDVVGTPILAGAPSPAGEPVACAGTVDDLADISYDDPPTADDAPDVHLVSALEAGDPDGAAVVGYLYSDQTYIDPKCVVDAASASIHKITQAKVRGQPTIAELAADLEAWLRCCDAGLDHAEQPDRPLYLCGHNAAKYDVPVLVSELRRVGRGDVADLLTALPVLDTLLIRKAAEPPNTLAGCLLRYGLDDIGDGAHDAAADVAATLAVLAAQAAYGHLVDVAIATALAGDASRPPDGALDAEGKLVWAATADRSKPPTPDSIIVNFTKNKGATLRAAGPGLSKWICQQTFVGDDTKAIVRAAWGPSARGW